MVSKARVLLPEPETPVITTSRSRGISTSMHFRLCSQAPLITILSTMVFFCRILAVNKMILFAGDLRREPRSAKNQKHCFDLGFSSHLAPRTSFLYFSHLICHLDGRNQAGGTGLAAPGQIVRGAVVHRGPHNRQA